MLDSETRIYGPGAHPGTPDDERVRVELKTHGCGLVFFFADLSRQGPVLELRILPDTAELAPHVLREFMPRAALYLLYARAAMTNNEAEWLAVSKALRTLGSTRRGLTDDFYKLVAVNYAALLAEGEPHPVKALGAMHRVTISAASRWVKEARRRGLLDG